MYALIDISNQMLEDSAFDMEGQIRGEATEQFAVKEGAEIRVQTFCVDRSPDVLTVDHRALRARVRA